MGGIVKFRVLFKINMWKYDMFMFLYNKFEGLVMKLGYIDLGLYP